MKITKSNLQRIIQEEINNAMHEGLFDMFRKKPEPEVQEADPEHMEEINNLMLEIEGRYDRRVRQDCMFDEGPCSEARRALNEFRKEQGIGSIPLHPGGSGLGVTREILEAYEDHLLTYERALNEFSKKAEAEEEEYGEAPEGQWPPIGTASPSRREPSARDIGYASDMTSGMGGEHGWGRKSSLDWDEDIGRFEESLIREELENVLSERRPALNPFGRTMHGADQYQTMSDYAVEGNRQALHDLKSMARTSPDAQAMLDAVYEENPTLRPPTDPSPVHTALAGDYEVPLHVRRKAPPAAPELRKVVSDELDKEYEDALREPDGPTDEEMGNRYP